MSLALPLQSRARTSTSKADSTPMRFIRSASFIWRFSGKTGTPSRVSTCATRSSMTTRSPSDAAGDARAIFERHDSDLIRGRPWRTLRARGARRFRCRRCRSHSSPRCSPRTSRREPPRFCARPSECRLSCMSPASQRICGHEVADLRHAGCAHGMAFGFQAAAGVDGFLAGARRGAGGFVGAATAALDEAEIFDRHDFGDGEAIVQLRRTGYPAARRPPFRRPSATRGARPERW